MSNLPRDEIKQPDRPKLIEIMGPGLITGASDDDPSGIATYSQVGAQFGYAMTWTMLFSYPLMSAIQEISARIGRVTGRGLGANLRRVAPAPLVHATIALLVIANVINIGADLGAMAAALRLLLPGPQLLYVGAFAVLTAVLEVFVRYSRYVSVLRWLTLSLLAYVATVFVVQVPWPEVGRSLVLPNVRFDADYLTGIVAVLGTTISPYLFFWQASEEVDELQERADARPLIDAPRQARREIERIKADTYLGMAVSNIVAAFIIITTAATLHAHGVTDIETSSQAAEALRPIAGRFAFTVFALGIVGTGLLAVPVLAGSVGYAVGEVYGWPVGLAKTPGRARRFYLIISAATLVGVALNASPLDPVRALFWSAVVNGVAAAPVMAMTVLVASRADVMGPFVIGKTLRALGWIGTAMMALAAVGMFATWKQ